MAPANKQNSTIHLNQMEINKLEKAFKDPEFRKLLVEYSEEINNPENRRRYEAEFKQFESESSGTECIFLHPKPGYVIKTFTSQKNGNTEKVFINVCSDENIAKPESKRATEGPNARNGVQWSIPYSLTKARKDIDKAGLSCLVYDIIFHPNALTLAERNHAMRGLLNDTALDAVEKCGDEVVVDRKKVRFPKMKFKGAFHPTVIRKTPETKSEKAESTMTSVDTPPQRTAQEVEPEIFEPKYNIKYRYTAGLENAAVSQGGRQFLKDPTRPTELVVDVHLPEFTSAKNVELDVEEKKMTLEASEPKNYKLVINFAYSVDEEKGSAKFDRTSRKLVITLPVKVDVVATRLSSTDSGIDIAFEEECSSLEFVEEDTAYRTSSECVSEIENEKELQVEEEKLMFPAYTCNLYDELMILKLDVKNVDEQSLHKRRLETEEGVGFSLRFTTVGSGMVPLKYGFDMIFINPVKDPVGYSVEEMDVEVWDNNLIVQMSIPVSDCTSYKVGSCVTDMKEHSLPQLREFKQKRKQLMRSVSCPATRCGSPPHDEIVSTIDDFSKERHSSGESNDSALSMSPPKYVEVLMDTSSTPIRGILKRANRGRCFSESQMEQMRLTTSASMSSFVSVDSSIPEEDEIASGNGSVCSKKSVRFSEVVHRQVFRSNSSILGQRQKNAKKAEQKKRRAVERRASEGDAGDHRREDWVRHDENEDSGLASSVEDSSNSQQRQNVLKKNGKKLKSKSLGNHGKFLKEANSDLIFDLDF